MNALMNGNPRVRLTRILLLGCAVIIAAARGSTTAQDYDGFDLDLERHLRQLESGDEMDQLSAAAELAALGPRAVAARQRLEKLLDNSNRVLQLECLTALGSLGPLARESAPAVGRFVNSDAAFLQIAALDSLRQIGAVPSELVPRIRALADAADVAISTAAARCLISAVDAPDKAAEPLLVTLVHNFSAARPDVRGEAMLGLMEAGPRVIPLVQPLLSSPRWTVRADTCRILAHFDTDSRGAAGAIRTLLNDRVELVVRAAAEAVGEIDGEAALALPMLTELLRRDSGALRLTAIRAIGRFGSQASAHVPDLLRFLQSTSPLERSAAAEALGRIGGGNSEAITALLPLLNDPHLVTARYAALALAAQGNAAVPYLLPRLKNDRQRITALEVLIEMGPAAETALPALLQGISGEFIGSIPRRLALRAVGSMGPAAANATPQMLELLESPLQAEFHPAAAWVLGRIGSHAAIPALQHAAESEDQQTRTAAAWALVMLRAESELLRTKAVPLLTAALDTNLSLARRESLAALAEIGPDALTAVPAVIRLATTDADPDVRAAALNTLAEIAPWNSQQSPISTRDVAALMLTSMDDPNNKVREAACYLAGKMQTAGAEAELQLRDGMHSGDVRHRVLCAWALLRTAPNAASLKLALPWMKKAVAHPDPWIREEAASALAGAAGEDEEARQMLLKLREDANPGVRRAAGAGD